MAKTIVLKLSIIIFFLSSTFLPAKSQQFSRKMTKKEIGMLNPKREKLSHLHFYFHDIASGKNPTGVLVAQASITNSSASGFGFVEIIDDPLTLSPNLSSKLVGRAQGVYASAAKDEVGLLMALNFVFVEGKYKGSSLSILGRNAVFQSVREMPIVGGSGVFRFARGYVRAKTHSFDLETKDAVVEYNVFVFHY